MLSLSQLGKIDLLDEFSQGEIKKKFTSLFENNLRATTAIKIESTSQGKFAFHYDLETGLWFGIQPWQDRADGPKAIEKLVLFALNAEIQDSLPATKESIEELGFGEDAIDVTFNNSNGDILADFIIGKSSAWKKKIEGEQEILLPTIYLRLKGKDADDTIYLCTDTSGDLHALFEEKLKAFRDHRAFALNINTLEEVRLKRGQTEIILSHPQPATPWKLTKPLELATDREATMKFLANISKIEAINLHDSASVSLPEESDECIEIRTKAFNNDQETTLTVYPPAEGAPSCYATMSDRDVVFELPLIVTPKVSNYITQLPKSVNELRSRNMMQWSKARRADLRSVIVRTPQVPAEPVIVARIPSEPYQLITPGNTKEKIDEAVFATLMQKIATTPVKDFASDAATDLSPFSLDKPLIVLDFIFFQSKPAQLRIGKTSQTSAEGIKENKYFANLRGTPIVWEVTPDFVSSIPTRYWMWQPREIWNLPVVDITQFTAHQHGKEKLTVNYDYLDDTFKAKLGEKDVSQSLLPQRAKFFLNKNHMLMAKKRLSPHNAAARKALEHPIFTSTITTQRFNNEGLPTEGKTHTLTLAKPSQTGSSAFYYAKADHINAYFILDLESVRKLAALDLLDGD